jgi:hypothetical protein
VEFDAFGVAVGCALVSGGLSVALPFLLALTGTLAALAFASWVVLLQQRAAPYRSLRGRSPLLALGLLGVGAGAYLADPPLVGPERGLLLGLALVPLWLRERNRPFPVAVDPEVA